MRPLFVAVALSTSSSCVSSGSELSSEIAPHRRAVVECEKPEVPKEIQALVSRDEACRVVEAMRNGCTIHVLDPPCPNGRLTGASGRVFVCPIVAAECRPTEEAPKETPSLIPEEEPSDNSRRAPL